MIDSLLNRYAKGDRLALSRLLSLAARGQNLAEISRRLPPPHCPARVLAVTGSGGVGKSSLVGKLITCIRKQGLKVAVLACDPQSSVSGGALLGDRVRMSSRPDDDGTFIRSLTALSGKEAVAEHLPLMVRLCEGFGFDVVLIETAGAGQGDIAVRQFADVVVLLVQPETGDDLQWEKAGVFEVADIVLIHKADMPGADQALSQVRSALELSTCPVPLLKASARTGEGIEELWQAIQACPLGRHKDEDGRDLLCLAQEALASRFAAAQVSGQADWRELLDQWRRGILSSEAAVAAALSLLAKEAP